MAKKWGLPPENPEIIPKETGLAKVKKRVKEQKEDTKEDDFASLVDRARISELKQELLKEKQLEYKNEREKIKLMQESQELVKFELVFLHQCFLFF